MDATLSVVIRSQVRVLPFATTKRFDATVHFPS
jgi:hypothetical protein